MSVIWRYSHKNFIKNQGTFEGEQNKASSGVCDFLLFWAVGFDKYQSIIIFYK